MHGRGESKQIRSRLKSLTQRSAKPGSGLARRGRLGIPRFVVTCSRLSSERSQIMPTRGRTKTFASGAMASHSAMRNWRSLGAAAVAAAVYVPSIFLDFIHDDHQQIIKNPQIQSWDYLLRLLTTDLWSEKTSDHVAYFYRPLFSVWMLLIHSVGGFSPWFWHVSSIALHMLATYLVFRLCSQLLGDSNAGLCAALLFALLPIHVDAVSWVSASNEILFAIFSLTAFIFGFRALATADSEKWRILSVMSFIAACFSKETAVALLPIFVVVYFLRPKDKQKPRAALEQALLFCVPYLGAVIGYLFIRWLVLSRLGVETGKHSWREVIYSAPSILLFYVKKLVWPVGLSGFYVNPLVSTPTLSMWVAILGIVAAICIAIWLAIRYSWLIGFAMALIIVPLIPVLAGIRVYDQGNMTHDRYLYLPSVGFCILYGLIAKRSLAASRIVRNGFLGVTALVCLGYAHVTIIQQRFYRNDEAFYQRGIDVSPHNALVIDYLGNVYLKQNEFERAIEQYQKAYKVAPENPNTAFFLARGFFKNQQYADAEPLFERLSMRFEEQQHDRNCVVLLSLATAQAQQGKLGEAQENLRRLSQLESDYPGLHRTLAIVLQRQGRIAEAQSEYAKEYQISGDQESRRQAMSLANYLMANRGAAGTASTVEDSSSNVASRPVPQLGNQ